MNKTEIARQYVEKYIEIAKKNNKGFSKRWIAKVMFEENPDIFKDYESARSYFRASLGVMGKNKGNTDINKNDYKRSSIWFLVFRLPMQLTPRI